MSSDWDGRETMVLAREVVHGDLLAIESGDTVPVDARIVESVELRTDEAVLTGESNPIAKGIEAVKSDASIGERKDMLYMGNHTIYGRGKAVVTSIVKASQITKQDSSIKKWD